MSPTTILKARGLAIIAVVFGHVNPNFGPQLGLFDLPIFFLVGGMGLNPDRQLGKVAWFVVVDLLFYASAATFLYSIVAAALEPLGLHFRFSTDWSPAHFTIDIVRHVGHHVGLALTAWFLIAYAGAVVVSEVIVRLIPRRVHMVVLAPAAALLFYVGVAQIAPLYTHTIDDGYWNVLSQSLVGASYMLAGYVAARGKWLPTLVTNPVATFGTYLLFAYLTNLNHPDGLGMVFSEYKMGWKMAAVYSALGMLGTLQLAAILDKVGNFEWLDRIGQFSKAVMMHHLFVFALINLAFIALGLVSPAQVDGVYWKFSLAVTWPIYFVLGVILPWLANEIRLRLKAKPMVPAEPVSA